ncbi:hypothetical protein B0G80_4925 [Paraburkholderia sp. BL6669N2]|uniref:hypothetical protein n=1 Tax=Paraburkholderia sp. BL6669N2 TaxID=1938807 RepID=UPI000E38F05B|nr:hypothetical protein [Paraburkholderia sp. BL6669N2]REG48663.1 hypothetical protein B0G80_4925 [Paraburkholderia sp. BL6669N2]
MQSLLPRIGQDPQKLSVEWGSGRVWTGSSTRPTWCTLSCKLLAPANALRHSDSAGEPDFVADLEDATCWMLVQACESMHRLGADREGFDAFDDWFYEHIIGIREWLKARPLTGGALDTARQRELPIRCRPASLKTRKFNLTLGDRFNGRGRGRGHVSFAHRG